MTQWVISLAILVLEEGADLVQVCITSALQGWQGILFTAAQVPSESSPHRALRAHPQAAAGGRG